MLDMSPVIVPKSDQISADDFISGPRTYQIESVVINNGTEQPVNISLVGENRVWKPCKSMARVLVAAWGPDAKLYSGRSVTLYRDPKVKWGGLEVGGVRISHMSHIDRPLSMALTATKGRRADYTVKPLILQVSPPPPQEPAALTPKEAAEMIKKAGNVAELRAVFGEVYKHFPAYDDATRDALTDLKDAVKLELTEAV